MRSLVMRSLASVLLNIGIVPVIGMTSTPAIANFFDNAFGSENEPVDNTGEVNAPVPQMEDQKINNLDALAELSSFPLRVQVGSRDDGTWQDMPDSAKDPGSLRKEYKLNDCKFDVVSGKFAVRKLARQNGGYVIEQDAMMAQYTFFLKEKEKLFLRVTTSVTVEERPNSKNCKKLFAGKRIAIGTANMTGTKLNALAKGAPRVPVTTAGKSKAIMLFITWNQITDQIDIVDSADMPVALESKVFVVSLEKSAMYYLNLEPAWKIDQKDPKSAKVSH